MATTRTATTTGGGPASLKAKVGAYDLEVIAEPSRKYGEVVVSTPDDDGPTADLVRRVTVKADGNKLTVEFPDSGGGMTVIQTGGGVTQVANVGGGVFIAGSNASIIQVGGSNRGVRIGNVHGDAVYVQGGGGVVIAGGGIGSPITVTARLPINSNVDYTGRGGGLHTTGVLDSVEGDTSGGNIYVDQANNVELRTSGGNVTANRVNTASMHTSGGNVSVRHVETRATLRTSGGDVEVYGADDARVRARTSGGNILHGRNLDCDASTSGGSVRSVKR